MATRYGSRFEPGDVVRLKSGGPRMTVLERKERKDDSGKGELFVCQWFAKNRLEKAVFDAHALVKDEDDGGADEDDEVEDAITRPSPQPSPCPRRRWTR